MISSVICKKRVDYVPSIVDFILFFRSPFYGMQPDKCFVNAMAIIAASFHPVKVIHIQKDILSKFYSFRTFYNALISLTFPLHSSLKTPIVIK